MGSTSSKIREDDFKLSEECPAYAKKFSKEMLYILMRLFEEYKYRFCYGISGLNTPYVEVFGPEEVLKELKKVLPYKYEKDCGAIAKRNRRVYGEVSNLTQYIWKLNREQCKEFFSIFKQMRPQVDRYWMHRKDKPSIFMELTQQQIDQVLYESQEECNKNFKKISDEFLNKQAVFLMTTRNISVLFGKYGVSKDLSMKLVYYENARPDSSSGMLRLYFYYYTYDDSVIVHNQLRVHKKMANKKRKRGDAKDEIDAQQDEEEMQREREKIERDIITIQEQDREKKEQYLPNGDVKPELLEKMQREIQEFQRTFVLKEKEHYLNFFI